MVHVDPDDNPVPGKPAIVHLHIENTEKGYDFAKSDCELTIGKDEVPLLTKKLQPSNGANIYGIEGVPFTFPTEGTYDITASCKPIVAGTFTAFDVDYDLSVPSSTTPVEPNTPAQNSLPEPLPALLFAGIIAASLFFVVKAVRS